MYYTKDNIKGIQFTIWSGRIYEIGKVEPERAEILFANNKQHDTWFTLTNVLKNFNTGGWKPLPEFVIKEPVINDSYDIY